ncbi:hypothetical protein BDN67DRAFT_984566 [Paxillus ammoniavirescens]|nr:hypothetical protein BDN67DRAFT_984566 [Paxillus ammoniavirescens]
MCMIYSRNATTSTTSTSTYPGGPPYLLSSQHSTFGQGNSGADSACDIDPTLDTRMPVSGISLPYPHYTLSNPHAHIPPHLSFHSLQEHCRALEVEVDRVTVERDMLRCIVVLTTLWQSSLNIIRATFAQLADAICARGAHLPSLGLDEELALPLLAQACPTPNTHPNIRFWNKSDYLCWTETPAASAGARGKLPYLEDADGNPIDNDTGMAPETWGQASSAAVKYVEKLMEDTHPLFTFVNNGWKLNHLAVNTYSGWSRRHLDGNRNLKKRGTSDADDEDEADANLKGKKRQIEDSPSERVKKKARRQQVCMPAHHNSPFIGTPKSPPLTSSIQLEVYSNDEGPDQPLESSSDIPEPPSSQSSSDMPEPPSLQSSSEAPEPPSSQSSSEAPEPPSSQSSSEAPECTQRPFLNQATHHEIRTTDANPLSGVSLARVGMIAPPLPLMPDKEAINPKVTKMSQAAVKSGRAQPTTKTKMRPGISLGGWNLCAYRWHKQILKGNAWEFEEYYLCTLTPEQCNAYDVEAKQLEEAGMWQPSTLGDGALY